MISSKSTQHFWSQLLLSMIAILSLPHAQGLNNATFSDENYVKQSRQFLTKKSKLYIEQKKQIQYPFVFNKWQFTIPKIQPQNIPHFLLRANTSSIVIRAGPVILFYLVG